MCKNYELDLQKEQEVIKSLESQLTQSRQNVQSHKRMVVDLEDKMTSVGSQCQREVLFRYYIYDIIRYAAYIIWYKVYIILYNIYFISYDIYFISYNV